MILDALNRLSAASPGDAPTAQGDTASANVIDQGVAGNGANMAGQFGAEIAPFLVVQITVAATSNGSATLQIVVQDSADNSSFADVLLGDVIALANLTINSIAFLRRLNRGMRRYIRVVYRIAVADLTAGKFFSFLTLEADHIDLLMRQAAAYTVNPSGALDESAA